MQNNPEIEQLVSSAVNIAEGFKHEFVTTEHLLLAMLHYEPFAKCLISFGVELDQMILEVTNFLQGLNGIVKQDADLQPRKTAALERVFNRGNVQVMLDRKSTR